MVAAKAEAKADEQELQANEQPEQEEQGVEVHGSDNEELGDDDDALGSSEIPTSEAGAEHRGKSKRKLPDQDWEERRKKMNRWRTLKGRRSKKARMMEQKEAEEAELQKLTEEEREERKEKLKAEEAARKAAAQEAVARLNAVLSGEAGPLPTIAIECTFAQTAPTLKEVRSLIKQMEYSVVSNKRAAQPLPLAICGLAGQVAEAGKPMGVMAWPVNRHEAGVVQAFPGKKVIVMSPDAEEALMPQGGTPLDPDAVYVIGGIVDRTIKKGMTLQYATEGGAAAYRLPIPEHAEALGLGRGTNKKPVLNVNNVVDALLEYHATGGDWVAALEKALPARKKRPHIEVLREMQRAADAAAHKQQQEQQQGTGAGQTGDGQEQQEQGQG